jgi:hypothetical protein
MHLSCLIIMAKSRKCGKGIFKFYSRAPGFHFSFVDVVLIDTYSINPEPRAFDRFMMGPDDAKSRPEILGSFKFVTIYRDGNVVCCIPQNVKRDVIIPSGPPINLHTCYHFA